MDFSIEEELPIILLKEFKLSSHVKGYHAYMTIWEPKNREFLETRLESEMSSTNMQLQSHRTM